MADSETLNVSPISNATDNQLRELKEDEITTHTREHKALNPVLRIILEGVTDEGSSLHSLRGTPHIVRIIWEFITSYWKSNIVYGSNTSPTADSFIEQSISNKNAFRDRFEDNEDVGDDVIEAYYEDNVLISRPENTFVIPVSYTHLTLPTKRIV